MKKILSLLLASSVLIASMPDSSMVYSGKAGMEEIKKKKKKKGKKIQKGKKKKKGFFSKVFGSK